MSSGFGLRMHPPGLRRISSAPMLPAVMAHMTSLFSLLALPVTHFLDGFSEGPYCTAIPFSFINPRYEIAGISTMRDTRTMAASTNQFLAQISYGLYSLAVMTPILAGCHEP